MSQLEPLRAHRDRMHTQLVTFRENLAAVTAAHETARTAVVNHDDQAVAARAQLATASADLAAAVGGGAKESDRAPLRSQVADLRASIEYHEAESARIKAEIPGLERNLSSWRAGIASPEQQYAAAHFEVIAREWVEALKGIAPLWFAVKAAARDAGRSDLNPVFSGLAITADKPRLAHLDFPDFPRG